MRPWKPGLLATWSASPVFALKYGITQAPAQATSDAELAEKSTNSISPLPTSGPALAEMELFRRADYTLPQGYCGWYGEYNSASYTCALRSASCINVGDYRGCCNGPSLSCASTFFSACIPSTSLTSSQSCGMSTICCSNVNFPECGTILFSSSANTLHTYTNIDCWSAGFGSTYAMQDYPPFLTDSSTSTITTSSPSSISETSATVSSSSSSTTSNAPPTPTPNPPSSAPIGPIVGGAVGGAAVLGLITLTILLIVRRNRHSDPSPPPQPPPESSTCSPPPPQQQQQQQMAQTQRQLYSSPTSPGIPPSYDSRYSYAAGQAPHQAGIYNPQMSPNPHAGGVAAFEHPSPPIPSPSPVKTSGGPGSPVQVAVNEAPATNPKGVGNNRAELA